MLNKINAALLKLVRPISAGQLELNQPGNSPGGFKKFKTESKKEEGGSPSGSVHLVNDSSQKQSGKNSLDSHSSKEPHSLENPPEVTPDWKQALRRNKESGPTFEPILQLFSILGKSRTYFKQWIGRRVYGDIKEERRKSSGARKGVLVDQTAD